MSRIFQRVDKPVNDLERVIIEGTTAIHERIMLKETSTLKKFEHLQDAWEGVVWKTYSDDIINDYKWESITDYISRLKQLRFKEVSELESTTVILNNKEYKKYIDVKSQIN